ncbi:hypothetical protein ACFGXU_08175 [Pasteurella multocida]
MESDRQQTLAKGVTYRRDDNGLMIEPQNKESIDMVKKNGAIVHPAKDSYSRLVSLLNISEVHKSWLVSSHENNSA